MKLITAVTGASGVIMSYYFLQELKQAAPGCEIHLILSDCAKTTWQLETDRPLTHLTDLADCLYDNHNLAAAVSSGSFVTDGMVILPCSMKTVAGIAAGYTENLIIRAADVCMKEGRKVVIAPREMPLSKLHLRNLTTLSDLNCVIIPPVLTFYNQADTVEKQIRHIVGKILLQFKITPLHFDSWEGAETP